MRFLPGMILLAAILQSATVWAAEDVADIAKAISNPLKLNQYAKHIALPLENDTDFGYGPYHNKADILYLKPVVPLQLTQQYDLIIRTIAPLYARVPTNNRAGIIDGQYISGWGDLNPTFFLSPKYYHVMTWGFGPTISIPTSTNSRFIGSGKWSVGPELALITLPGDWFIGLLTSNIWSIAGNPARASVNQFSFQYFASYTFKNGWYFITDPTITANWKQPGNKQWLVPVGAGVGHAYQLGEQSFSWTVQLYYNAIRPAGLGPDWQTQLTLEFMLPPLGMHG